LLNDEEHPALCRWAERYVGHETAKQCLPRRDELVAMYSAACKDIFRECRRRRKSEMFGEAMPKRNKC
jgi:hypothetical protein